MESQQALIGLAALAQETRLAIFRRLVRGGPQGESAGTIAEALKTPAPTLSFHLKELERAGLITQRRESRSLFYAANYDGMRELLAYLVEDCCAGRPEFCNFKPMENCNESPSCSPACE